MPQIGNKYIPVDLVMSGIFIGVSLIMAFVALLSISEMRERQGEIEAGFAEMDVRISELKGRQEALKFQMEGLRQ